MRTALLTPSVSRAGGGVSEVCRRLGQSLAEMSRMQVEVFGLTDSFTEADRRLWNPLCPKTFSTSWPRAYGYAPQLNKALEEIDPDVAHVHGIWMYPSVAARRWANRRGRPYLITVHGMLEPWALGNSPWKKRVARWLVEDRVLHAARCLHVNTRQELLSVRKAGFSNPVCIIPNGVDLPAHPAACPPPWQGLVEPEQKILLYLGRLHPKKGLCNLLQAYGQILSTGPSPTKDWTLVVVGWDQGHLSTLKELARSLGIEQRVVFTGPQFGEVKSAAYQNADAFILPSYSEGLPLVILEAWAHRLPVLMTPHCNLPEGFATGSAIHIDTTADSIIQGLKMLFSMDAHHRRGMGERGRKLVEEQFTWNRIANDLSAVYRWLVEGGPMPDSINVHL